jgi:small subunit ribosomal protein S18
MTTTAPTPTGAGAPRTGMRRRPGEFGGTGGGRKFTPRRKVCQFCVDKIKEVDYKDLGRLRRFLSERGKIEPRRKTGTCATHQRSLNVALKRARQLALLPFTAEHIRVTGVLVREPGAPPFRGARPRPPEIEGEAAPAEAAAAGEAAAAAAPVEAAAAEASVDGQSAPSPSPESPAAVAEPPSTEVAPEVPEPSPATQEA